MATPRPPDEVHVMIEEPSLNVVMKEKDLEDVTGDPESFRRFWQERKPCRDHLEIGFQEDCAWCQGELG